MASAAAELCSATRERTDLMAILYIRLASPPPRAATRSARRRAPFCAAESRGAAEPNRFTIGFISSSPPSSFSIPLYLNMHVDGIAARSIRRLSRRACELYAPRLLLSAETRPAGNRGIGGLPGGHLPCKSPQLSWILISNSGIMQIGRMNFSRSATGRCHHRRRCDGARPSTETAPARGSPSPSPFSGAVPLLVPFEKERRAPSLSAIPRADSSDRSTRA
jgi:hypothetical protein